jgi:hypothetical protein
MTPLTIELPKTETRKSRRDFRVREGEPPAESLPRIERAERRLRVGEANVLAPPASVVPPGQGSVIPRAPCMCLHVWRKQGGTA